MKERWRNQVKTCLTFTRLKAEYLSMACSVPSTEPPRKLSQRKCPVLFFFIKFWAFCFFIEQSEINSRYSRLGKVGKRVRDGTLQAGHRLDLNLGISVDKGCVWLLFHSAKPLVFLLEVTAVSCYDNTAWVQDILTKYWCVQITSEHSHEKWKLLCFTRKGKGVVASYGKLPKCHKQNWALALQVWQMEMCCKCLFYKI